MSLILKILPKRLLPPYSERNDSYIYFCYDKLEIYLGQGFYNDSFCIVEKPVEANIGIEGMIYIMLNSGVTDDGMVYTAGDVWSIGYDVTKDYDTGEYITSPNPVKKKMAELEKVDGEPDPEQLAYLNGLGTLYFQREEYKYFDTQKRTISLPFQNGTAKLSIDAPENLRFDTNTVTKYNPLTGKFEYDDNYVDPDELSDPNSGLKGYSTKSVDTYVKNNQLHADVRISDNIANGLKILSDGLYVNTANFVPLAEFNSLKNDFEQWSTKFDETIVKFNSIIEETYSEDNIKNIANTVLEEYKPNIELLIKSYEEIYDKLNMIYQAVPQYIDDKFLQTKIDILNNAYLNLPDTETILVDQFGEPLVLSNEEAEYVTSVLRAARDKILADREQ